MDPVGVEAVRQGLFGAHGTFEVRTLLWKGLGFGDLKPAAFVDAGVLTDDARSAWQFDRLIAARELGVSVGAGLRYVMPVGPAVFDCAVSPVHRTNAGVPIYGCDLAFGYAF